MADSWRVRYSWSDIFDDPVSTGDGNVDSCPKLFPSQPPSQEHVPGASTCAPETSTPAAGQPNHPQSECAGLWRLNYSWGDLSDSPAPMNTDGSPEETYQDSGWPEPLALPDSDAAVPCAVQASGPGCHTTSADDDGIPDCDR